MAIVPDKECNTPTLIVSAAVAEFRIIPLNRDRDKRVLDLVKDIFLPKLF
jgi:hypothetical protein